MTLIPHLNFPYQPAHEYLGPWTSWKGHQMGAQRKKTTRGTYRSHRGQPSGRRGNKPPSRNSARDPNRRLPRPAVCHRFRHPETNPNIIGFGGSSATGIVHSGDNLSYYLVEVYGALSGLLRKPGIVVFGCHFDRENRGRTAIVLE